jgi:hypothetical protein
MSCRIDLGIGRRTATARDINKTQQFHLRSPFSCGKIEVIEAGGICNHGGLHSRDMSDRRQHHVSEKGLYWRQGRQARIIGDISGWAPGAPLIFGHALPSGPSVRSRNRWAERLICFGEAHGSFAVSGNGAQGGIFGRVRFEIDIQRVDSICEGQGTKQMVQASGEP